MKVKILKSSFPTYWYSDKVGMEFQVVDTGGSDYEVVGGEYFIDKCDCVRMVDVNLDDLILN